MVLVLSTKTFASRLEWMPPRISWEQALAWRLRRHYLDPIGRPAVAEIVDRLCGVQAQVASSAELAIRVRRETSQRGEVDRALRDGRLIKTWAMRGTLHLFTPESAGTFLSLMASGRSWERPSWQRYFGMTPKQMQALRRAAQAALADGPLMRDELVSALSARRGLRHAGEALRSGWGTLLKPLAWHGDLCFGPSQGSRVTFMRPEDASSHWRGIPDADRAAPSAITAYFSAYAPTTMDAFGNWLAGGWFGKRQLRTWFDALGESLVEVEVDEGRAFVLAEDLDELRDTPPTSAVRLLPGFDQYVLGPGTGDAHVIATSRRTAVSRQAGWISPVVVVGGVVRGTWELDGDQAKVVWFAENGRAPLKALEEEVGRLSSILDRGLRLNVSRERARAGTIRG
jgi:Winged helix DNA-binding domain